MVTPYLSRVRPRSDPRGAIRPRHRSTFEPAPFAAVDELLEVEPAPPPPASPRRGEEVDASVARPPTVGDDRAPDAAPRPASPTPQSQRPEPRVRPEADRSAPRPGAPTELERAPSSIGSERKETGQTIAAAPASPPADDPAPRVFTREPHERQTASRAAAPPPRSAAPPAGRGPAPQPAGREPPADRRPATAAPGGAVARDQQPPAAPLIASPLPEPPVGAVHAHPPTPAVALTPPRAPAAAPTPRAPGLNAPRLAPATMPAPVPEVTVTIGRVDVRVQAPAPPDAQPTPASGPRRQPPSLDAYLRARARGRAG